MLNRQTAADAVAEVIPPEEEKGEEYLDGTEELSLQEKALEKKLRELLIPAFDTSRTSTAKDKDIVLVVGTTGAGKSTTVSYAVGCEMGRDGDEEDDEYNVFVKDDKGRRHPEIGKGVSAKTIYPDVFESEQGIQFCDCPGFNDTRGQAYEICTTVSVQAAIGAAKSIRAIMVVLDHSDIVKGRAKGLRSLIEALEKLLVEPNNVQQSVLFVITKKLVTKNTKKNMFSRIGELVETFSKELDEALSEQSSHLSRMKEKMSAAIHSRNREELEKREEELSELKMKLKVLKLMQENNTIFINPLDNGHSRDLLVAMLTDLVSKPLPVSKREFRFNFHDHSHIKFKQLIFRLANQGDNLAEKILDAQETIKYFSEEISIIQKRNDDTESMCRQLEDGEKSKGHAIQSPSPSVQSWHKLLVAQHRSNIILLQNRIMRLLHDQMLFRRELEDLDRATVERHWYGEFKGSGFFWAVWKPKYRGMPYDMVKRGYGNGEFSNTQEDKKSGRYSAKYASDWFTRGDAWVEILVARNVLNRSRIKTIKDIDRKIENTIVALRKELESEKEKMDSLLKDHAEKVEVAAHIRELRESISNDGQKLNKLKINLDETEKKLSSYKNVFKENLASYELVINVLQVISAFNSMMLNNFVIRFTEVVSLMGDMRELCYSDVSAAGDDENPVQDFEAVGSQIEPLPLKSVEQVKTSRPENFQESMASLIVKMRERERRRALEEGQAQPQSKMETFTFELGSEDVHGVEKIESIHLVGSFNNWLKIMNNAGVVDVANEQFRQYELKKNAATGRWTVVLELDETINHQYKFLINLGKLKYPDENLEISAARPGSPVAELFDANDLEKEMIAYFPVESAHMEENCLCLNIDKRLSPNQKDAVLQTLEVYQKAYLRDLMELGNIRKRHGDDSSPDFIYKVIPDKNPLKIIISGNIKIALDCIKRNRMSSESILNGIKISMEDPRTTVAKP